VEDGVLRVEGLLDVGSPTLPVICRSVFNASGWVRRSLSAIEYLRAFDMPVGMDARLAKEKGMRSKLLRTVSPLVVSSILRAMWGESGGGVIKKETEVQLWKGPKLTQQAERAVEGLGRKIGREESTMGVGPTPTGTTASKADPTLNQNKHDPELETEQDPPGQVNPKRRHETSQPEAAPAILEKLKKEHYDAKAVKADDAEVPVHLWDQAVFGRAPTEMEAKALDTLRQFLMRVYCHRLWKEIRQHMAQAFGNKWATQLAPDGETAAHQRAVKEATALREILWRATNNDWFEYPAGSRLIFFRFPTRYVKQALEGVRVMYTASGPHQWKSNRI
jgi:hypothetical protein